MHTFRNVQAAEPAGGLLSLAGAKVRLGVADTSEDATLTAFILSATAAIEAWCNRWLVSRTATETIVPGSGEAPAQRLVLSHYPATVTALTVDGETIELADLHLYPETGIIEFQDGRCFEPGRRYVATYGAGFATVPAALETATFELVRMFRDAAARDLNVAKESVPDVGTVEFVRADAAGGSGAVAAAIPGHVQLLLFPYRSSFGGIV